MGDLTPESARIDRWLWAIRLYKTRSAAADACKGGHVTLNGRKAKPAAAVRIGDTVHARVGDWQRIVEVVRPIEKRVGAKVAVDCYTDHSPARPARDPLAAAIEGIRDPGTGRPTKRDRREMDRLRGRRR